MKAMRCWPGCSSSNYRNASATRITWLPEKDLLIWDNLGTIHRAIADYRPDEIRLIRRCQVMATWIVDPEFAHRARAA